MEDTPEQFCSKCGGSTPHTVTLYGLVCDLCGTPRPTHVKDSLRPDED